MREKQSKATQAKHERMLNELFKLPGNEKCADCTAKNPRWASYSLGLFLCIRCCSLHRKMGTHISKVKSVSMDRWTLQEIQLMIKLGGNSVINNMINSNPQKHPLPIALDDDHAMERYIRDKWEKKSFKEKAINESMSSIKQEENSITSLQQLGDSTTSIGTDFNTPSLSSTTSSLLSSPTMQLAGRVTMDTQSSTLTNTYNPFLSLPSSFTTVAPVSNNNPFLQQQQLVQSPFDINYNVNTYFHTSHRNSNNSHNPFCQ
ncbi:hypothetical protein EDC94DRAFT_600616 [Helicostylum pulchrum]|nr:hypothetical protein EDC94DRAFT_600616 [Helicostylum pulchrum]